MKALGVKLIENISILYGMDVLTPDERIEYAELIKLAMVRHAFYGVLKEKLQAKLDEMNHNEAKRKSNKEPPEAKYLNESIELLQNM